MIHPPFHWTYAGKVAAVIGYAIFFVYLTVKAVQREVEREDEGEVTDLESWI